MIDLCIVWKELPMLVFWNHFSSNHLICQTLSTVITSVVTVNVKTHVINVNILMSIFFFFVKYAYVTLLASALLT